MKQSLNPQGVMFRRKRRSLGLTQAQLADVIGLSQSQIIRIEQTGKTSGPVWRLLDMLTRHGIPADWRESA